MRRRCLQIYVDRRRGIDFHRVYKELLLYQIEFTNTYSQDYSVDEASLDSSSPTHRLETIDPNDNICGNLQSVVSASDQSALRIQSSDRENSASDLGTALDDSVCIWCSKRFGAVKALNRHIRTHTLPETCLIGSCRKPLADRKAVKRHRLSRKHTEKGCFPCTRFGCDKTFTRRDSLTRHLKKSVRCSSKYVHNRVYNDNPLA